jgi:regulator of sigma E protease
VLKHGFTLLALGLFGLVIAYGYGTALLAIAFLIVVHEAGHLFVARWCRMRVERFSIGFGSAIPGLSRRSKSGTLYQIAPIPFGGFVEIRGMNIAEEVDPEDKYAYPNRPAWQRFLTIFAGPATNYLGAIALAFLLFTCHGVYGTTWHIDKVKDGYDAKGKLEPGDRIVAVNDVPMYGPNSTKLSEAVNKNPGAPVKLKIRRGNTELDVVIQPRVYKNDKGEEVLTKDGKKQYLLGVQQDRDVVDVGVGEAAWRSLQYPVEQTQVFVAMLGDIFSGKEKADPGGPVRIVKEFEGAFSHSWVRGIQMLMAFSVWLGLLNLFPLPALDGGRLVFLAYELVTRRRANPKIEAMVHMVGIMLLGVIMILVTVNDVISF